MKSCMLFWIVSTDGLRLNGWLTGFGLYDGTKAIHIQEEPPRLSCDIW